MANPRLRQIQELQGSGLRSPFAGQLVTTRGVVTGKTRKGFFLQDPAPDDSDASPGIFVFSPRRQPAMWCFAEVTGKVLDFLADEDDRPTTQIQADNTEVLQNRRMDIEPIWLNAKLLDRSMEELRVLLNSLEGRLVGIEAGATFVAPSNSFGDYVVIPKGCDLVRTEPGGVLIDSAEPQRWLPNLRIRNYARASRLDVGARLDKPLVGPLNYRASSYQIAASGPLAVTHRELEPEITRLAPDSTKLTVLTLNGFNLDPHVENPRRVNSPRRDVDDDVGDGRFDMLAEAIVLDAQTPDIVALQEIQDNDGAEMTTQTDASSTYRHLIRAVQAAGGPEYHWADIPPKAGADGGQPGGNIRCGFLFQPERVQLVAGSLKRIGDNLPAFEGSRKPILARFQLHGTTRELAIVNVHLASKRNQHGIFAPDRPGFDPRLELRIDQVNAIRDVLRNLHSHAIDFYVTGDFNDFEFSDTLAALNGDDNVNLVDLLPPTERYDYNHRGISQALMHGIVSKRHLAEREVEYQILHRNALLGVEPGSGSYKGSDHAYVIARLEMG